MLEETEYGNLQLGTILLQFRLFLNLTCCFSKIKLSAILTSPSSHSSRNFARYFCTVMNFLPARLSHIPVSQRFLHSLLSTWLLAEIAMFARYQMTQICFPILLTSTFLFCFFI